MEQSPRSFDPLLEDANIRQAAATLVGASLASWPSSTASVASGAQGGPQAVVSSRIPGTSPSAVVASAATNPAAGVVASAAPSATAASPGQGLSGIVSSAAADAFASAIAHQLGFVASPSPGVLDELRAHVASALRTVPQFAGNPEVASALGAMVASTVGTRILASSDLASVVRDRVSAVLHASSNPLTRRTSIDG
jgi:hypothetical protein